MEQWLRNPTFEDPIEPTWLSVIEGDYTDVDAMSGSGEANFAILGESNEIRFNESLTDGNWKAVKNPYIPLFPDTYEINSSGCCVSHYWDELVNASRSHPSVHWKKNFTMPVNMSDYVITSASLKVKFNASVTAVGSNPLQPHLDGGIEVTGDYTEGQNPPVDTQFEIGDSANFYVLASDVNNDFSIQIAHNQTKYLGRDNPYTPNITDTFMRTIPQEALINLLNIILEKDHFNFTVTLGIDILCEDNEWNVDSDHWKLLIIKSFDLTLTYQKKMNQLTTVSWVQVGNQLNGDNLQVTNARLNFMYKIDQLWPDTSNNSELRIFINNIQHTETIKLSTANTTFKAAKLGGFNVTNLIKKDVNVSLSIQVNLAEDFLLDHIYFISIDNVFLEISYRIQVIPGSDNPFMSTMVFISVLSAIFIMILLFSLFIVKPRIQRRSMIKKNTNKAKTDIENFEYNLGNLIKSKLIDHYNFENWERGIPFDITAGIRKKAKKAKTRLTIDTIELLNIDHLKSIVLEETNWKNIFCETFVDKKVIGEKFENLITYKNKLYQGNLEPIELDKHLILIQAIRNYFIRGLTVFLSYATVDTTYYRIAEIAQHLERYSDIEKVFYWEVDSEENIVKYMEQSLQISKVFILLCSENSLKSKSVQDEWQVALQLRKKGIMKMIPVYENEADIPLLLGHILKVRFNGDDFEGFVEQLHREIMR
ncbi:MAG: toll/interleukin-1 receptor domain-containing protein [Promethearchaeota archaeon]